MTIFQLFVVTATVPALAIAPAIAITVAATLSIKIPQVIVPLLVHSREFRNHLVLRSIMLSVVW